MIRRGQTATEYLIILAVVIVIALIVVGVLGGIPGVGQSGQAKSATAYWSTTDPIAVAAFSNSATDGVRVVLRNNGKNPFTVTAFKLDTLLIVVSNSTLPIGSEVTLFNNTMSLTCVSGNKFAYDAEIDYIDQSTGAAYTFRGTQKLEGSCAL